jgi:hypothetical protein
MLVFWPYLVFGQNHLYVRMLQTGIPLFIVKLEEIQVPYQLSGRYVIPSGCLLFLLHPSGRRAIPSGHRQSSIIRPDTYTVSRNFCVSLLPSGRFSSTSGRYSVLERFSDSFQVPRMGRSINHPDDVAYCSDTYLHKARIAVQI